MTSDARAKMGHGPFRPEQLKSGDSYEISNGHAIFCAPTGGDGGGPNLRGGFVLDTDPMVKRAGVDTGFQLGPLTMRAPDVSVGDYEERPGWVKGVPPLAIEYASVGQDERELAEKIDDLRRAGTQYLWVVRLTGPRRVEVYERAKPVRVVTSGQSLSAPGVLQNDVPIEALYDRDAAMEVALRNLLQRKGHESLEALQTRERDEGKAEGKAEAKAEALLRVLRRRGFEVDDATRARIDACRDADQLDAWLDQAVTAQRLDDVFSVP